MFQDASEPPAAVSELIVTARLPRSASEPAFSVVRLEAADIQGSQRLDQAIASAPGASLFRRNDSLAANPTVQGLSLRSIAPSGAGRALVTLDGVPQNDPFGGWVIWASLPNLAIDGASIVRGGGSGPYGAGALTGVVALEERARDGIAADARYGSMESSRAALVAEGKLGPADVLFSASGGRSDGYIPVRAGRGSVDQPLNLADWSTAVRTSFALADTVLSVRLGAYDERRGSGVAGSSARATGQTGSVTLVRAPGTDAPGWRLQGWVRASDMYNSFSAVLNAARTTWRGASEQYETPATGYGFNAAMRGGTVEREWEIGADVRAAQGETREFFGIPVAGVFPNGRKAGGNTLTGGLYVEGVQTTGDWLLTGGVRMDYWSASDARRYEYVRTTSAVILNQSAGNQDGWLPTARAGFRRDLDGAAYVRGAAYAGFRAPTLNELHRPFRVGNDITEANPALEPEKLYGAELAVGRKSDGHEMSLGLFYNQVVDPVTNVTLAPTGATPWPGGAVPGYTYAGFVPAGGSLRQRRNAGTINAWGLEGDITSRWSDDFSTRLAASYTDAEVDGGTAAPQLTGLRPAQAPKLTVVASADWRVSDDLTLSVAGRYESDRFEDDQNSRVLKAATVIDARAAYRLSTTAEAYISLENLTDEAVQTAVSGTGLYSYGAPRMASIGITIRR